MASEVAFQLDRKFPIYFVGEVLRGIIHLTTTTPKKVRNVCIVFLGVADVDWKEVSYSRYQSGSKHVRGHHEFVHSKTETFNADTLPPGTHTYTFNVQIPDNCITSCTHDCGRVVYKLQLILNIAWGKNETFELYVTVIKPLDLNMNSSNMLPLQYEHIKEICCWPCRSGVINARITLPYSGYVPGQDVCYTLNIENNSLKTTLRGYEVYLLQRYTFMSDFNETTERDSTLCLHKDESSLAPIDASTRVGQLRVPMVPPSTPDEISTIMRVKYLVQVKLLLNDWHCDAYIELPITIGTVPLHNLDIERAEICHRTFNNEQIWDNGQIIFYTQCNDNYQQIFPDFSKQN